MRLSTVLGASCLGVLVFLVMTSKTGGMTFEGGVNKAIALGGALTKPPTPTQTSGMTQQSEQTCPAVTVQLPPNTDTVILGDSPSLIIDTEGKETLTITECVDLSKVTIDYCDNKAVCKEGALVNGHLQAKSAS